MNTSSKKALVMLLALILVLAIVVVSCKKDEAAPVTVQPQISLGTANFSKYVAIGNSLTAGYQSGGVRARDEQYAYPNLLARHLSLTDFQQPKIKDPGIGPVKRLVSLTGPVIVDDSSVAPVDPTSNLNFSLNRAYNNLGVPGMLLAEAFDETPFLVRAAPPRSNPFFYQVLRADSLGKSIVAQARKLNPTFITLWLGNNDILGYATTGGVGAAPTDPAAFATSYGRLLDTLKNLSTTPGIVVGNIPDVYTVPFFTTVGPQIKALVLPRLPAGAKLYFQAARNVNAQLPRDSTIFTETSQPLITLAGSAYVSLIGQPTGKWYRDLSVRIGVPLATLVSVVLPGTGGTTVIDTTKPFGVDRRNPWPNALTLDATEQATAASITSAYNSTISSLAAARNIGVVDFNRFLRDINQNGVFVSNYGTFSTSFISGGMFSYDGVHPTSRGYVIVANEWIKAINQKFNATIPMIDVGAAPGIPIGKISSNAAGDYGSFDSFIRLIVGNRW